MNLLQKAIIKNVKKEFNHMPYSETALALLKAQIAATDDPHSCYILERDYEKYCAENKAYKAKQESIYGTEFNEKIALKKGSKTVKKTLTLFIKILKLYSNEIQERYIPQAKMLLDVLKGKQTCTDEQIQKALEELYNISFDIWLSNDDNSNLECIMNVLDDISGNADIIISKN